MAQCIDWSSGNFHWNQDIREGCNMGNLNFWFLFVEILYPTMVHGEGENRMIWINATCHFFTGNNYYEELVSIMKN